MKISLVPTVLMQEGLGTPTLNALVPNEANYTVLLMQPKGEIEGSTAGVRNKDRNLAKRQFEKYLEDARETQADLVVTPEYSMPWDVLTSAIKAGISPIQGKLWVLGCESIKYSELIALKHDLEPYATTVLFETLQPAPHQFTDPLAYVFLTPTGGDNGDSKIVILVQFKTYPMGDDDHFEINGLQRGTRIYQFGGGIGQEIKLVSLICSDAFAFADEGHAEAIYDRALVLHIQLNQKPRHTQYRQYRDRLFRFGGDSTELICLNWARNVNEWSGATKKEWGNIGGSAWYLRPMQFDGRDETLCLNHQRGFYYTWFKELRVHAMFFNYEPATYLLEASKVAHIGVPAAISRRRGPQIKKSGIWDNAETKWVEQVSMDAGFSSIIGEAGDARAEIEGIANTNPLEAERVMSLCAGQIEGDIDWHRLCNLDSFAIDLSEVIFRLTFCQDIDKCTIDFRIARLKRVAKLWKILQTEEYLPTALKGNVGTVRLCWSLSAPHQNALLANGELATVIYMGEETSTATIEATKKKIAEYLHRSSSNVDKSLSAKQRLAVWYRNDDQIVLFDPYQYVRIDQTGTSSEFDIGRES
jgi:hypothetical protein